MNRSGLSVTFTARCSPPTSTTAPTPVTASRSSLICFFAISVTSRSFRPGPPETTTVTTGAASRLNFSTTGGSVP